MIGLFRVNNFFTYCKQVFFQSYILYKIFSLQRCTIDETDTKMRVIKKPFGTDMASHVSNAQWRAQKRLYYLHVNTPYSRDLAVVGCCGGSIRIMWGDC